jgi:hypothetical protein
MIAFAITVYVFLQILPVLHVSQYAVNPANTRGLDPIAPDMLQSTGTT